MTTDRGASVIETPLKFHYIMLYIYIYFFYFYLLIRLQDTGEADSVPGLMLCGMETARHLFDAGLPD
jgi:hypothetical protein